MQTIQHYNTEKLVMLCNAHHTSSLNYSFPLQSLHAYAAYQSEESHYAPWKSNSHGEIQCSPVFHQTMQLEKTSCTCNSL